MAKAKPFIADEYLDNLETIAAYLNDAFETGDDDFIAKAIGTVAHAFHFADAPKSVLQEAVDEVVAAGGERAIRLDSIWLERARRALTPTPSDPISENNL